MENKNVSDELALEKIQECIRCIQRCLPNIFLVLAKYPYAKYGDINDCHICLKAMAVYEHLLAAFQAADDCYQLMIPTECEKEDE